MPHVAANGDAIAAFMVEAVRERVVANLNAGRHKNHDFTNPDGAEWNVDSETRHTMRTSMEATGSGTTVTLRLIYTVETI